MIRNHPGTGYRKEFKKCISTVKYLSDAKMVEWSQPFTKMKMSIAKAMRVLNLMLMKYLLVTTTGESRDLTPQTQDSHN